MKKLKNITKFCARIGERIEKKRIEHGESAEPKTPPKVKKRIAPLHNPPPRITTEEHAPPTLSRLSNKRKADKKNPIKKRKRKD